jgi:hypothetical protein
MVRHIVNKPENDARCICIYVDDIYAMLMHMLMQG